MTCIILSTVALFGCGRFETEVGRAIDLEQHSFTVGQTRLAAVTHSLGPPTQVSALPGGIAYLYEYTDAVEWQLGFSLDYIGREELGLFKLVAGRGLLDHQVLVMTFDGSGTLTAVASTERNIGLGTSFGLQTILDAEPVIDLSNYQSIGEQSGWGSTLLEPPPTVLNSRQSLESGASGLQLRGTPGAVGQHSLEHRR